MRRRLPSTRFVAARRRRRRSRVVRLSSQYARLRAAGLGTERPVFAFNRDVDGALTQTFDGLSGVAGAAHGLVDFGQWSNLRGRGHSRLQFGSGCQRIGEGRFGRDSDSLRNGLRRPRRGRLEAGVRRFCRVDRKQSVCRRRVRRKGYLSARGRRHRAELLLFLRIDGSKPTAEERQK